MLLSLFFLFIFITSNLGYILWIVDRLDVQAEAAPVFVIFAQMVILYFCSLAGLLQPAMIILYALGWLLLGVVLVKHRRDLRSFLRKQATPGFVFFLLIVPLLWFQTRTWKFANWDEFSHWGLIFKEISQTNLLPGLNTTLIFPDYPPGTALYQVFINYLMRYEEGSAYFAQGLMMLSPLVSLTHHFKWKKWYAVLGVYTAGFLLVNQMNYTLNSIYVDGLIGILFGTSAAFFLTHKEPNKKTFLYLLPMLLALPLIKKSGIFFSLSVTLLALGSYLFLQKGQFEEIKNWLHRTDRHKWGNALAVAVLLLAVIAGPLLVAASWSRHVTDFEKETGIQITAPVSISLEKLNHSFFGETTPRDDATITAFVKGLQEKPFGKNGNDLTTRHILVIFLAMVTLSGLALFDQDPIEKRNYFILQGSTLTCVLLYFLAILISYLYIFGEYEGTRVASFDRYIGTALLGWGILILAYVALPLRSPERFSRRASGLSLAILVAIVLALFLKTPMQTYLIPAQGYKNGRPQIIALVNKFIAKLEPDSKIYNVWQNSTGIEHYMIRYELAPRQTQIGATSLGKPYQDTDVWTVDIESTDWMALLQKENFNYVLVSQPDLKYWDQYGSLFKDFDRSDEAQLFRVTAKWLIRVP